MIHRWYRYNLCNPDGSLRRYPFNTDTVRFTPATAGSADNTAQLTSCFSYRWRHITLYVHGKDKTGNPAGNADYSVSFEVYNKPMITNMLIIQPIYYVNGFVFTLTGSQVPQNIRIQILTIRVKIVREITTKTWPLAYWP